MSIRVMSAVWSYSKAEGTDLLVLLALADRADDEGGCYPSQTWLAKKCRVSERTVRRSIAKLEDDLEEIKVQARNGTSNTYRIVLVDPGQSDRGTPDNLTAPPDTLVLTPRTPVSSDTSGDPSPKRKRRSLSEIPTPFVLRDEDVAWVEERYPYLDWVEATEAFHRYWAGEGKRKKDWYATWRNGMSQYQDWGRFQRAAVKGPVR